MSFTKVIILLTVFTLIVYLGICYLLYRHQENMLFYPEVLQDDFNFQFPFAYEEVYFTPDTNTRLHALLCKTKQAQKKGVILYCHGNAGSLRDWGNVAPDFLQLGYDILIPDYRGYGKSVGKRSEKALHADAQLMYNYLLEQHPENTIILYGRSLGTGVISTLATKTNPKMVILETPYLNIPEMAGAMLPPVLPIKQLIRYQLDNAGNIVNIKSPVHLFHGTEDELVPYQHSQQLAKILNQPDILHSIQGGAHNNLAEFPSYHDQLAAILK